MLVPKASMHKNDLSEARKHEVGGSRKVAAMQSEAIAERVNDTPDQNLGFCVFPANPGH
jgi:hypothetical protein